MFKDLFAFLNAAYDEPTSDFEKFFFDHLSQMAFYSDLNEVCKKNYGEEIPALLSEKKYKEIVSALLGEKGLNYGHMPKGALKFHTYGNDQRTPFEEHLVEGALYAKVKEGDVNVHFTVSPEHRALFDALVKEKSADIEKRYGVKLHISFSEQNRVQIHRQPMKTIRLSEMQTVLFSSDRVDMVRLLRILTILMPMLCSLRTLTMLCLII